MGNVITSILTDANMRSTASVESALHSKAEAAQPWYNQAEA